MMTIQEAISCLEGVLCGAELLETDVDDIVYWLQKQEPRVMTLDEVKKLQSLHDGAVWIEASSGLFPALPEICMSNITFFVAIPLNNYRKYFENEYYGKTWRCWTARPTNEQRKAVKWDDII